MDPAWVFWGQVRTGDKATSPGPTWWEGGSSMVHWKERGKRPAVVEVPLFSPGVSCQNLEFLVPAFFFFN